ncbi:MAG: nucleoside triphosphate pyrophosphohydrolase [Chloroflexi bacterium]|nr:nucleoside triphosphate pyrophosphohydrolase [Chloroflexota bacterium]
MPRREYNKLVRDNIPEIIAANGQALRQKLVEEAQEVLQAKPDELVNELADVYEVLDALIAAYDLDETVCNPV